MLWGMIKVILLFLSSKVERLRNDAVRNAILGVIDEATTRECWNYPPSSRPIYEDLYSAIKMCHNEGVITSAENRIILTCLEMKIPETFDLRGHEGTFRVSIENSYTRNFDGTGELFLYTQKARRETTLAGTSGTTWIDFAKGSPEELRSQIVRK